MSIMVEVQTSIVCCCCRCIDTKKNCVLRFHFCSPNRFNIFDMSAIAIAKRSKSIVCSFVNLSFWFFAISLFFFPYNFTQYHCHVAFAPILLLLDVLCRLNVEHGNFHSFYIVKTFQFSHISSLTRLEKMEQWNISVLCFHFSFFSHRDFPLTAVWCV